MAVAFHGRHERRPTNAELRADLRLVLDTARYLPRLRLVQRARVRDEVAAWVRDQVLRPTPLDRLTYDELAIRYWTRRLAATPARRTDRLQELLFGLHALLAVYLWKDAV